jgi:pimeloyl-ACP methyl ester carboxylesterase
VWIDVVKRLSGRRRVIAVDLPGRGQSDSWGAPSIALYRDAVGTICATLGLSRVVLVGHSMGGAIALSCAIAWPERVSGLVLVCSGARMRVARATLDALAHPQADAAALMGAIAYSPSTAPEIVERWCGISLGGSAEAMRADLAACDGFDVRGDLKKVQTPSLAIGGSDDLLLPSKLTLEAAAGLVNARAVILPHTGHMAFQEQPDAFHAALDPFLVEVT